VTPHLSAIVVYPLKGARGTSVPHWEVDAFGPRFDRRWMIVDPRGVAVTQRERPRLALLQPHLEPTALVLTAVDAEPLRLAATGARGRRQVVIWDDAVEAEDMGDDAARWVSGFLDLDARLVHMPSDVTRQVSRTHGLDGDRVGFADAYPFLLISQAALDDLNHRTDQPIPMNRFRPNLVIDGVEPHAEDGWAHVRIGAIAFDVVKPCARCTVPTIDQETGQQGKEPLRTLATYRRTNGKVTFGQNLIHRNLGELRVGDVVEATARR
jgi:uncharacterized protein YcbX